MMTKLKNQFFQASFLTLLYCLLLLTLFAPHTLFSLTGGWRLVGIAVIAGIVFGVCYPAVWQLLTWPAPVNIIVTSMLNFLSGFAVVYLLSPGMGAIILPYWWAILVTEFVGHTIAFYFYRRYQNRKLAAELNEGV